MDCKKKEEDAESVVSDSCWEPRHHSESRKWLIRDAAYKLPRDDNTETKSKFVTQQSKERHFLGARRSRIIDKYTKEIAEQLIKEQNPPIVVEDYCTEYDSNYLLANFDPNKKDTNEDLYRKYPLYSTETHFRKSQQFTRELCGDTNF
ncbi:hypothetical protein FQR65_LT04069 [Abscondita terminalis]|nr:hypothetical protein FQR65_LT04069 [Abscondita terminalis]